MSSEQARELRQQGIAAAKAGQREQARQLLQQAIRLEPRNEAAWLWIASVARDQRERVFCLRKLLEINPNNEQALKALRQIETGEAPPAPPPGTGSLKRLTGTQTGANPPVAARLSTQEIMAQPPGVPFPDEDALEAAIRKAEALLSEPAPEVLTTRWSKKTKGRAGEQDIWRLRAYVGAGALAGLVVLCGISYIVVANTPPLARAVFAPTPTLTLTPTFTPTSTPGVTPTPSATPRFTPEPTMTLLPQVPVGDIYSVEATDVYPPLFNAPLEGAVSLIDRGLPARALPTLVAERENTSALFNPIPYYYEAIAYAETGNTRAALRVLNDAEERLTDPPNMGQKALIDTGFAYVYLAQIEAAAFASSPAPAAALTNAQARAQAAIEGDPRLVQAHVLLARTYVLEEDFDAAIEVLDAGLSVPDNAYNTSLICEKARVYLLDGDLVAANEQTRIALAIDPTLEAAYQVEIAAALADDQPGIAVQRAQAYLLYYPGSTEAFRLLGDARFAEGNYDLALEAYDRALSAEQSVMTTVAALIGRAATYTLQARHVLALEDLTQAYELREIDAVRLLRMEAAYHAGSYEVAAEDAEALSAAVDAPPDGDFALLHARILIDQAQANDDDPPDEALSLLESARTGASSATRALINEYRARALFLNRQYGEAREAINAALDGGETAERLYLRGLIAQQLGQRAAAIRDFEAVLAWSQIYVLPFADDAAERLEALS
ncbi:MAG: tetratricopeptide repeat protein [Chloroflexota bacterium]|nr:tetratricopeptide repeat protein [Chloroflexota bacterium]